MNINSKEFTFILLGPLNPTNQGSETTTYPHFSGHYHDCAFFMPEKQSFMFERQLFMKETQSFMFERQLFMKETQSFMFERQLFMNNWFLAFLFF